MKFIYFFSICFFLFGCASPAHSPSTNIQEWKVIPVHESSSSRYDLNALFLSDTRLVNPPLVVLSHGSPFDPKYVSKINVEGMLDMGKEFLKLGFAVLIVERRGYGKSKEKYMETIGDCDHRNDIEIGKVAAEDILGATDFAQAKLKIDPTRIVLAGHSTGGYSSLFAGSIPHAGVKAVLNFAGGRGSKGDGTVCSQDALLKAYSYMGRTSRIPGLWIYAENDTIFTPKLARELFQVFTSHGGVGELTILPPFQDEGHSLFGSPSGVAIWMPVVKTFLKKNGVDPTPIE